MNNLGSAASVYHNHGSAPRVAVRLKGLSPNTQGIGGKIKLLGGAVPMQSQEVVCGGMYLSGSDPERVFAAGQSQSMTLEVTWRNGKQSVVRDVKPNRIYEIDEAGAAPGETNPPVEEAKPFFKDVSELISHRHHQEFYDDFARQALLPWQLSQDGPGIAWVNLLGDNREELVIGSGRGGELGVYAYDGKGGMRHLPGKSPSCRKTSRASWGGAAAPTGGRWWWAGTITRPRTIPPRRRCSVMFRHPGNKTCPEPPPARGPWRWRISMGTGTWACSWAGG